MKDISSVHFRKYSPEDRESLKNIRKKLRRLWFPPMDKEIRAWRNKTGINSAKGLTEFAKLSRVEKENFFKDVEIFVRLVENAAERWYEKLYSTAGDTVKEAYSILGIKEDSSPQLIKKRYYQLILKSHPDRGGSPDDFVRILNAYRKIRDSI